jgi:hypothetical protein
MNRRTYLSIISASIAPQSHDDWIEDIQARNPNPSLKDFLLPKEALDENYDIDFGYPRFAGKQDETDGTVIDTNWSHPRSNRNRTLSYRRAERNYEVTVEANGKEAIVASVRTVAMEPRDAQNANPTTPGDLHKLGVRQWFSGEPSTDYFTGWVDAELQETEAPTPRTDAWYRLPILYRNPATEQCGTGEEAPYEEKALSVVTTDWGVLKLQHNIKCPSDPRQAWKTARYLMDGLADRARRAPAPVSERGRFE